MVPTGSRAWVCDSGERCCAGGPRSLRLQLLLCPAESEDGRAAQRGWGPLQPTSSVTGLCSSVSAAAEPPPAVTRGDEAVRLCREGRGGLVVLGEAKHRLPGVPQRSPSLRVPSSPPAPLLGLTSFRKLCGVTPASALSVPDCIPSPRPPSVWLALCDVTVPLNDVTFLQNGGDE